MSVHLSRARWFALTGVALISSGLGFTGAKILANESIAYIAHYKWLVLMIIGVPLVLGLLLTGAILNLFGRMRWFGFLGVTAGVLIVASSFASFKILDALGQVQYKLEQIVFIGPDVKADLIVYFKRDVTQDQIKYFWESVLTDPDPQGRGSYYRNGVGMVSSVYPPVEGHEGIAINFFASASEGQREQLKRDINASPVVFKVLENVAPSDIKNLTNH